MLDIETLFRTLWFFSSALGDWN